MTYKMKNFMINYFIIAIVTIYGVSSMTGGEPAAEGQFKYVVSIQKEDKHHCSGIIINEMHIVTAAHAVDGIPSFLLSVVAGKLVVISPSFQAIPVQWIQSHFHFKSTEPNMSSNQESWDNDIAVLKLSREFTWGPTIAPAPLMNGAMVVGSCNSCIMPGWHYEFPYPKELVSLYWNTVYHERNIDEQGKPIRLADHQRCIGDLHQLTVIENEDVGVPVVCNNYVVGLVVKGGEVTDRPSIYLEIFPYLEFLLDVVNDYKIDAGQNQFPFSATLWNFGEYVGNGIIYDDHHVITIERLIQEIDRDFLKVIAGRILVEETDYVQSGISIMRMEDDIAVERGLVLGIIAKEFAWNGIAILILSEPVAPEYLGQLQLGEVSDARPEHICRVLRWFREENAGEEVWKLKTSPAIKLTSTQCKKRMTTLQGREFCAVNPYSKILAEEADIGNPIVCEGKVIGIMKRTIPRASNLSHVPVVFVNVHRYGLWDCALTGDVVNKENTAPHGENQCLEQEN